MPKILAIIVSYNAREIIDLPLQSLQRSTIEVDVLCIDNSSHDGTADYLRAKYPEIETILLEKNIGFGRANNIGIKICLDRAYDYALLLNQDASIEPDCLKTLVKVSMENSSYGIFSPIHRGDNASRLDQNFSAYLSSSGTPYLIDDLLLNNSIRDVYQARFLNAAIWLMTQECLKLVGVFDEDFVHYGEDEEYCLRALRIGLKLGVVPSAIGRHVRYKAPVNPEDKNFSSIEHMKFSSLLVEYKSLQSSNLRAASYLARRFLCEIVATAMMADFRATLTCAKVYPRVISFILRRCLRSF